VAVPERFINARVWRVEMPTGLSGDWVKPLGKPARSMSQAAGSLIWPLGAGQWGISVSGMERDWAIWVRVEGGTMGFLKKEPAERESGVGLAGSISIPLVSRMARTAS
jgi:hypothetical protein